MTPSELVAALEAAGVRLRVFGGRLDLESASEPPRALLDELVREKISVIAFLREREEPPPLVVRHRRTEEPPAPVAPPETDETTRVITSTRPVNAAEVLRAGGTVPPGFGRPPVENDFLSQSYRDFRERAEALLGPYRR